MVSRKIPVKTRCGASHAPIAKNTRIALAVSQFNRDISGALQKSCEQELIRQGVQPKNIKTVWVPGAFELPWACQQLASAKKADAVIALGAVIRGETPHFDCVAFGAALGIMKTNLSSSIPIIFGVLTTDTVAQARDRIRGGKRGDKGVEFACAALQMINLKSKISNA
ncbi:6,7-dimethyl-8-ribityllumazine synthase [Candidatus Peregrinibacteria bacterium]|nr:6,7-dimethyl-8-ribityllumazine synthase [Candidatus Peregrinibacteria bacterium]